MTVLEVIQRGAEFLARKGVDSPRLQIEWMVSHVLNLPRLQLYLNFERRLTETELAAIRSLTQRRGQREPLQHILGTVSFCGYELTCSPAALIPRPETELLAERAWTWLKGLPGSISAPVVIDLGTGSGCIAIAIAGQVPAARLFALDISPEALALARANAVRHNLAGRIEFFQTHAFEALPPDLGADLIVSNPPYIPSAEILNLDAEVRDHDPRMALDGGEDGLEFYRLIAGEAHAWLRPGGRVMLEMGDDQAPSVRKLFASQMWIVEDVGRDYTGRERFFTAHLAPNGAVRASDFSNNFS